MEGIEPTDQTVWVVTTLNVAGAFNAAVFNTLEAAFKYYQYKRKDNMSTINEILVNQLQTKQAQEEPTLDYKEEYQRLRDEVATLRAQLANQEGPIDYSKW